MASLLNMSGGSLLGKGLPYDAEVEYLKGDGSSYIDSLVAPTSLSHPIMEFRVENTLGNSNPRQEYIIGSDRNGYRFSFAVFNKTVAQCNEFRICNYYYWKAAGWDVPYTVKEDAVTAEGFLNGIKVGTGEPVRQKSDGTILVFAMHTNNGWSIQEPYATIKIYWVKIYDGDTVVRDFIPVRVGTTGYMYDKVSGQLFGNNGTGNFILGPDKH